MSRKFYRARISLVPIISAGEMDTEDAADPLLRDGGSVTFLVGTDGEADEAEEAALDTFHETVAIAVLDHFDISAHTEPLSRHEEIAMIQEHPSLRASGTRAVEVQ